jgi:hypothetical protein
MNFLSEEFLKCSLNDLAQQPKRIAKQKHQLEEFICNETINNYEKLIKHKNLSENLLKENHIIKNNILGIKNRLELLKEKSEKIQKNTLELFKDREIINVSLRKSKETNGKINNKE